MSQKQTDVLVLGATGFTGRLVTRYLSTHPQFLSGDFTFAIAGRSISKLQQLLKDLDIDQKRVPLVELDVLSAESIAAGVKTARVVINVVGPFQRWGKPVITACVDAGVHHVDLTGEPTYMCWAKNQLHDRAQAKGVILVPNSGQDSIPSDISVYLSNKALKAGSPGTSIDKSITAFKCPTDPSGGSIDTMFASFNEVTTQERVASGEDFSYSPVKGVKQPSPRLTYSLPLHPDIIGGFFIMQPVNKLVVQRTWGLQQARLTDSEDDSEARALSYGPNFTYDEFLEQGSHFSAAVLTLILALVGVLLSVPPFRHLLQRFVPKPGSGPSESLMQKGTLVVTNVSSGTDPVTNKRVYAKSILRGRGDPGYLLTSVEIAECALAIALEKHTLPKLGQQGGVLTPMSALGDVLIRRLERSGRFEFEQYMIDEQGRRA